MTFVGSATGSSLPIQLIYRGKSNKCLSKFTFFSNFYVTFTPNYCSNLVCSYFSTKKKDLGYPEDQHSLIIMDTFKGQDYKDLKQLCAKNNCELVIVPHDLMNKFHPLDISINESGKKFI